MLGEEGSSWPFCVDGNTVSLCLSHTQAHTYTSPLHNQMSLSKYTCMLLRGTMIPINYLLLVNK